MYSKLKVLLLVNEFRTWYIARHLSYSAQLGIEEGLRASGVQCLTVTTPWLPRFLDHLKGRRFDQVWVAGRLDVFDEASLDRIESFAPIRLGMLSESSEYTDEECRISPGLRNRKQTIEKRLRYLTHALACDEKDAAEINGTGSIPAIWWPQAVPERFISDDVVPPSKDCAVFYGNRYALRHEYLRHPDLKRLLTHPSSPEMGSIYPLLFTALHLPLIPPFRFAMPIKEQSLAAYLSRLRVIRQHCYESWFKGLQTGRAVVNLPHFVKTYAGRVVEGMAAGRPVISWEIPDRPRNKALFQDDREILLFTKDDPHQLAGQIKRILTDAELSRRLVVDARRKLRQFHTLEIRVRQILDWLINGTAPVYS